MAISNPFSTAKKAKVFTDQMAEIIMLSDRSERLVAYAGLKEKLGIAAENARAIRTLVGAGAWTLGMAITGIAATAVASVPGFSLGAFVVVLLGGCVASCLPAAHLIFGLEPLTAAKTQLKKTMDVEVKAASLDDMRMSPHAEAALDAVPALDARFQIAARRALLLGVAAEVAPAAVPASKDMQP